MNRLGGGVRGRRGIGVIMGGLLIFEGVRREEVNGGVEGIERRDYG